MLIFALSFRLYSVIIIFRTSSYCKNVIPVINAFRFIISFPHRPHPRPYNVHFPFPPSSLSFQSPLYLIKRKSICDMKDIFTLRKCLKNTDNSA